MPCLRLVLAVVGMILVRNALADPHLKPTPEDYLLRSTIELSTGQLLPAGTPWYRLPDIERLRREVSEGTYQGDVEKARRVIFGHDMVYDTYRTIGDGRKDGRPSLGRGRIMSCTNCHAQGGTVPYAWPFFRTLTLFGLHEKGEKGVYFGGLAYHRDARARARDCGRECGGAIMVPDDSHEMDAFIAWLKAVRDGIYPGEGLLIDAFKTKKDVGKIPGAVTELFAGVLDMKADPKSGARIYASRCKACHGAGGLGKWVDGQGYIFPPLAGEGSFSHAGGPLMVPVGASFLHQNMPLRFPRFLSDQDALDVMAYVATLPRSSVWWQEHYFRHDPCSRPAYLPLHVGAVPKGYPYSKEQTQFGPWRPIAQWLASDACKNANPPSRPALGRDFDADEPR